MRGINIVAKKESSTKSFVLRVDAETMDAIEKPMSFAAQMVSFNGLLPKP